MIEHPSFPLDVFPEPLRQYIREVSDALPCAPEAVALPLLAAFGSAIGNTRRIALKGSWNEPPVIWAAVIARSGTLKSPAHDAAVQFLGEAQDQKFSEYTEARTAYERDVLIHEKNLAAWRRDKLAPDDPPVPPPEPMCTRYATSDATVEALAAILEQNSRGILVERDELAGWVGSFDRYAARAGGDVPAWLSMHRAGPITIDRKTGKRIIHVSHAHVCVAGTIQPETLRRILTPEYFDCGLPARLLLAMPTPPPKKWSEATPSDQTIGAMREVFARLLALEFYVGEDGPRPYILPLSPEAKTHWIAFYDSHAAETETMPDAGAAAWAKLEAYAARIALIFALTRNPDATEIDERSMIDAIRLARWFCAETRRVYAMLSGDGESLRLDEVHTRIIRWIVRNGADGITARELAKSDRRYAGESEGAETDLRELATAGYGTYEYRTGCTGRPRIAYRPNDALAVGETTSNTVENHTFADADTRNMDGYGLSDRLNSVPLDVEELNAAGETARLESEDAP